MIKIRRNADRGYAHFGWLESRHTFSFGSYFDPELMGISELRVANDDLLHPGASLDPVRQQDMEIVSYVLDGQTLHQDSLGNNIKLAARSVQVLSSGSGAQYTEHNTSTDKNLNLLQYWIVPNQSGTAPAYQSSRIPMKDGATLLVSPDGQDNSLKIQQQLYLYQAKFDQTNLLIPMNHRPIVTPYCFGLPSGLPSSLVLFPLLPHLENLIKIALILFDQQNTFFRQLYKLHSYFIFYY